MSDEEISTDRLTGRQLKELLALASTDAKVSRNWLLEIGDMEQLEYLLMDLCRGTEQYDGAILRAVCSPYTPVESLMVIKNTAKRLAVEAQGSAQKAAGTLLYHLSVASALAHHARNISSKNPSERLPFYKHLAAELFDDELAVIFEKAIAALASAS